MIALACDFGHVFRISTFFTAVPLAVYRGTATGWVGALLGIVHSVFSSLLDARRCIDV
jgi:hypothetical protein